MTPSAEDLKLEGCRNKRVWTGRDTHGGETKAWKSKGQRLVSTFWDKRVPCSFRGDVRVGRQGPRTATGMTAAWLARESELEAAPAAI